LTRSDFSGAFKFDKVPFKEVNLFGKLVQTYLDDPLKLQQYISQMPSLDGILEACRTKEPIDRMALVREIKRQYEGIPLQSAVQDNIHLLENDYTFCIVTAHQLNLFLGPLYYIHKVLSIVKTADVLNKKGTPYQFVPVFVMGSEDHDKEEVNHMRLHDALFYWETPQTGPVGRFIVDEAFIAVRDRLLDTLHDQTLKEAIISAYAPGVRYSLAHRRFLHYLFQDYGLVIVDMDAIFVKEICHDIFKDEIQHQRAQVVLKETLAAMEKEYDIQARPRSINIFKLEHGAREYISGEEEIGQLTVQDYSPNVIYRPLMQQKVLPAVCYVGGGGELGYWLEMKALFDYHQVQFPVLMLRNHAVYSEKKVKLKMNQWGIDWKDIWKETDLLANEVVKRTNEFDAVFHQSKLALEKIFEKYQEQAVAIDPTLAGAVAAEHSRVLGAIAHLEQKFVKGAKRKNENLLQVLEKAKNTIFPQGALMERNTSFLAYYDQMGKAYFDLLLNEMEPFSKEIVILQY
jgi:uncharacterized protein YllA (UPF0747 family)